MSQLQGFQQLQPGAPGAHNPLLSGHVRGLPPQVVLSGPIPHGPMPHGSASGTFSLTTGTGLNSAGGVAASQYRKGASMNSAAAGPSARTTRSTAGGGPAAPPSPQHMGPVAAADSSTRLRRASSGHENSFPRDPMKLMEGVNMELVQLVARHAPLELELLRAQPPPQPQPAVVGSYLTGQATVPGSRRTTAGGGGLGTTLGATQASRRQTHESMGPPPGGYGPGSPRRSTSPLPYDGVNSGPAVRGNVRRDYKILPNPAEQKRMELEQRKAAAHALVEKLQAKRRQQRSAEEERARAAAHQLALSIAAETKAARDAAQAVTVVPDPKPSSKPRPNPGDEGGASNSPGASKRDRHYEKPWKAHMRKPGAAPPPPLAPEGSEAQQALLPPDVPLAIEAGPPAARAQSPGPTRVRELDPQAHAQLQEYMVRKRDERLRMEREVKEAEEAQRTARLRIMREEGNRAREIARKHAEVTEGKPLPKSRPAWVDTIEDTDAAAGGARRAHSAPSRRRALNAPDVDAVSVRAMPNSTARALVREASGAKMRVVGVNNRSPGRSGSRASTYMDSEMDHSWENDLPTLHEDDDGAQVIRVRDPQAKQNQRVRPASAPKTSGARPAFPPGAGPLQERPSNVAYREYSPGRQPIEMRYLDLASRAAAMRDYGAQTRELLKQQEQERERARRKSLRAARQQRSDQRVSGSAAGSTAVIAAALFPDGPRVKASKKRRANTGGAASSQKQTPAKGSGAVAAAAAEAAAAAYAAARAEAAEAQAQAEQQAEAARANGDVAALKEIAFMLMQRMEALQQGQQQLLLPAPVVAQQPPSVLHQSLDGFPRPMPPVPAATAATAATRPPQRPQAWSEAYQGPHGDAQAPAQAKKQRRTQEDMEVDPAHIARPSVVPAIRIPTLPVAAPLPDPTAPAPPDADSGEDAEGGEGSVLMDLDALLPRYVGQGSSSDSSSASSSARQSESGEDERSSEQEEEDRAGRAGWMAEEQQTVARQRQEEYDEWMSRPQQRHDQRRSSDGRHRQPQQQWQLDDMEDDHSVPVSRGGQQVPPDPRMPGPGSRASPRAKSGAGRGASSSAGASSVVGSQYEARQTMYYNNEAFSDGSDPASAASSDSEQTGDRGRQQQPLDCEAVVQAHEQRYGVGSGGLGSFEVRPAKKALFEAAARSAAEQRLQQQEQQQFSAFHAVSAAPAPEVTGPAFGAAGGGAGHSINLIREDSDGGTPSLLMPSQLLLQSKGMMPPASTARPATAGDPLSVINILARRVAPPPSKPVVIALPTKATEPAVAAAAPQPQLAPQQLATAPVPPAPVPAAAYVPAIFPAPAPMMPAHAALPAAASGAPGVLSLAWAPSQPTSPVRLVAAPAAPQPAVAAWGPAGQMAMALPPFVILPNPAAPTANQLPPAFGMAQPMQAPSSPQHAPASPRAFNMCGEYMANASYQPQFAAAPAPQGPQAFAGVPFGSDLPPPDAAAAEALHLRLSPYELQRQLQEGLRKYEEVESMERELLMVEQARAVAAVQQEAHRLAEQLDRSAAAGQQREAAALSAAEQEAKFMALAESLRREVRGENLQNLKDVTAVFVQQFKANRIAHAEVQTLLPSPPPSPPPPPPPPALPMRTETGVQVSPLVGPAASSAAASAATKPKSLPRGSTLLTSTAYSEDFEADATIDVDADGQTTRRRSSMLSDSRVNSYSMEVEEEADLSGSQQRMQSKQTSYAAGVSSGSGGAWNARALAGRGGVAAGGHSSGSVPSEAGLRGQSKPGARSSSMEEEVYSEDVVQSSGSQGRSGSRGAAGSSGSVLDELQETRRTAAPGSRSIGEESIGAGAMPSPPLTRGQHHSATGGVTESLTFPTPSKASDVYSEPATPHSSSYIHTASRLSGGVRSSIKDTPWSALRAGGKGAAAATTPSADILSDVMRANEVRLLEMIARLEEQGAALKTETQAKLAQIAQQRRGERDPQNLQVLMRNERVLVLKLDMDEQETQRQAAAAKGELTRLRLQSMQYARLLEVTGTPGAAAAVAGGAGSGARGGVSGGARAAGRALRGSSSDMGATPTRSTRPVLGNLRPAAAPSVSYSEDIPEDSMHGASTSRDDIQEEEEAYEEEGGMTGAVEEEEEDQDAYTEDFDAATGTPYATRSRLTSVAEDIASSRITARDGGAGSRTAGLSGDSIAEDIAGETGRTSGSAYTSVISDESQRSRRSQEAPAQQARKRQAVQQLQTPTSGAPVTPGGQSVSSASSQSVMSAELDAQRRELEAMLAAKQKQLRQAQRREANKQKLQEIAAMQQQLAQVEASLKQVQPQQPQPVPGLLPSAQARATAAAQDSRYSAYTSGSTGQGESYSQDTVMEEEEDDVHEEEDDEVPEEEDHYGHTTGVASTSIVESVQDADQTATVSDEAYSVDSGDRAPAVAHFRQVQPISGRAPAPAAAAGGVGSGSADSLDAKQQRLEALRREVEEKKKQALRLQAEAEERALQQELAALNATIQTSMAVINAPPAPATTASQRPPLHPGTAVQQQQARALPQMPPAQQSRRGSVTMSASSVGYSEDFDGDTATASHLSAVSEEGAYRTGHTARTSGFASVSTVAEEDGGHGRSGSSSAPAASMTTASISGSGQGGNSSSTPARTEAAYTEVFDDEDDVGDQNGATTGMSVREEDEEERSGSGSGTGIMGVLRDASQLSAASSPAEEPRSVRSAFRSVGAASDAYDDIDIEHSADDYEQRSRQSSPSASIRDESRQVSPAASGSPPLSGSIEYEDEHQRSRSGSRATASALPSASISYDEDVRSGVPGRSGSRLKASGSKTATATGSISYESDHEPESDSDKAASSVASESSQSAEMLRSMGSLHSASARSNGEPGTETFGQTSDIRAHRVSAPGSDEDSRSGGDASIEVDDDGRDGSDIDIEYSQGTPDSVKSSTTRGSGSRSGSSSGRGEVLQDVGSLLEDTYLQDASALTAAVDDEEGQSRQLPDHGIASSMRSKEPSPTGSAVSGYSDDFEASSDPPATATSASSIPAHDDASMGAATAGASASRDSILAAVPKAQAPAAAASDDSSASISYDGSIVEEDVEVGGEAEADADEQLLQSALASKHITGGHTYSEDFSAHSTHTASMLPSAAVGSAPPQEPQASALGSQDDDESGEVVMDASDLLAGLADDDEVASKQSDQAAAGARSSGSLGAAAPAVTADAARSVRPTMSASAYSYSEQFSAADDDDEDADADVQSRALASSEADATPAPAAAVVPAVARKSQSPQASSIDSIDEIESDVVDDDDGAKQQAEEDEDAPPPWLRQAPAAAPAPVQQPASTAAVQPPQTALSAEPSHAHSQRTRSGAGSDSDGASGFEAPSADHSGALDAPSADHSGYADSYDVGGSSDDLAAMQDAFDLHQSVLGGGDGDEDEELEVQDMQSSLDELGDLAQYENIVNAQDDEDEEEAQQPAAPAASAPPPLAAPQQPEPERSASSVESVVDEVEDEVEAQPQEDDEELFPGLLAGKPGATGAAGGDMSNAAAAARGGVDAAAVSAELRAILQADGSNSGDHTAGSIEAEVAAILRSARATMEDGSQPASPGPAAAPSLQQQLGSRGDDEDEDDEFAAALSRLAPAGPKATSASSSPSAASAGSVSGRQAAQKEASQTSGTASVVDDYSMSFDGLEGDIEVGGDSPADSPAPAPPAAAPTTPASAAAGRRGQAASDDDDDYAHSGAGSSSASPSLSLGSTASPALSPARSPAAASFPPEQQQQQQISPSGSNDSLVDAITDQQLSALVNDSVEKVVGVAGGPAAVHAPAAAAATAPAAAAPAPAVLIPAQAASSPASSPSKSPQWRARKQSGAAASEGPFRSYGGDSSSGDDSDSEQGSHRAVYAESAPRSVVLDDEDDLGWGGADDGDLDLLGEGFDVGQYVSPERDQQEMRKEAEAAAAAEAQIAAPLVATSREAVQSYVGRVMNELIEQGGLPEALQPGQEPLSLDGFLALERSLPDASDVQHIYNKHVYDAANEALIQVYRQCNRIALPSWRRPSQVVKPLPAPDELARAVQETVDKWESTRVRGDADLDKILVLDAAEEDRAWNDLTDVEADIKTELAEALWDDLLEDTASVLVMLEERRVASRQQQQRSNGGNDGSAKGASAMGGRTRLSV